MSILNMASVEFLNRPIQGQKISHYFLHLFLETIQNREGTLQKLKPFVTLHLDNGNQMN